MKPPEIIYSLDKSLSNAVSYFSVEGDLVKVTIDDGVEFVISAPLTLNDARDPKKYSVSSIFGGRHGERETSVVRVRDTDESTVGYVFPISSLVAGDELPDNKWTRIYAGMAIYYVLFEGVANNFCLDWNRLAGAGSEISLDKIVDDRISILVLGKENLKRHGFSQELVQLMMLREGGWYPEVRNQLSLNASVKSLEDNINICLPSEDIKNDVGILLKIINIVDSELSPVAKFITLYQIMEYLVGHIFDVAITEILENRPTGRETWKLREQLQKVAGERWRLAKLDQCFVHWRGGGREREALLAACQKFLNEIDNDAEVPEHWVKALYNVRNIIVHQQVRVILKEYINLSEICEALRYLSLDMVCFFDKKPRQSIFS